MPRTICVQTRCLEAYRSLWLLELSNRKRKELELNFRFYLGFPIKVVNSTCNQKTLLLQASPACWEGLFCQKQSDTVNWLGPWTETKIKLQQILKASYWLSQNVCFACDSNYKIDYHLLLIFQQIIANEWVLHQPSIHEEDSCSHEID